MSWKRIKEVRAAEEALIELYPRVDRRQIDRAINQHGEEAFLKSISQRAKYEFLLGKIVEEGYVGTFPKEIVWEGATLAWETDYKVVNTKPKGEVQITPTTSVTCRLPK